MVYDLDAMEFREGRPEDYLTLTTGINYNELDANDALIQEIKGFLTQILPVERVREYVLRSFLLLVRLGDTREHPWPGLRTTARRSYSNWISGLSSANACWSPIVCSSMWLCCRVRNEGFRPWARKSARVAWWCVNIASM